MKSTLSQISNPFSVFYDQDKNKYFRINKMNGQVEPSYKSGKIPAQFDPDVSGTSYKNRKVKKNEPHKQKLYTKSSAQVRNSCQCDKDSDHLYQPKIDTNLKQNKKYSMQVQKISQKQESYQLGHKQSKNSKSIHLILPQNINIDKTKRKNNKSSAMDKKNNNFNNLQNGQNKIKGIIHFIHEQIPYFKSTQKLNFRNNESISPSRINIQTFENRLKKFAHFQQQKTTSSQHRNTKIYTQQTQYLDTTLPSILNDSKITKNYQKKSLQKGQSTINKRNVNTSLKNQLNEKKNLLLIQKNLQRQSKNHLQSRVSFVDSSHKQKQQLSENFKHLNKQKLIFLQFHPKYHFKQNQKLIQQQRDRKLNFKKLQKLFIENNNRETSKIYRSISKSQDKQGNNDNNQINLKCQ